MKFSARAVSLNTPNRNISTDFSLTQDSSAKNESLSVFALFNFRRVAVTQSLQSLLKESGISVRILKIILFAVRISLIIQSLSTSLRAENTSSASSKWCARSTQTFVVCANYHYETPFTENLVSEILEFFCDLRPLFFALQEEIFMSTDVFAEVREFVTFITVIFESINNTEFFLIRLLCSRPVHHSPLMLDHEMVSC